MAARRGVPVHRRSTLLSVARGRTSRDVIDLLLQKRRNGTTAKRFLRELLKGQPALLNQLVADKLGSDRVAHRELMSTVAHDYEPIFK